MFETASGGSRRASERSRRRTQTAKARPKKASPNGKHLSPEPSTGLEASRVSGNRWWLELVLSVIQAPVGIAQSQAEFLVTQLERTGNIGQREAERLLSELRSTREKAQGRAEQEAGRIDRFIEGKIEDVLNRINIPSRSDIERLNHSVDVLTAKVEALVSRQERGGSR
ncbi:MAG TPA: phasin family protein [Candidatus Dormibacteraeota bacterium]|jgi:poly(hydroxyalkanoate) granule-associated protein|nr:phasin family protein [Candidatus Dormibacteraeota bacterium]